MKLYPNLVAAVVLALEEIFSGGGYADQVVEHTLKKDARWGARDRKFIALYIYDIVRWHRLYSACLNQGDENNYYALCAVALIVKGHKLPIWKEFEGIDEGEIRLAYEHALKSRKLRLCVPDWLDDIGAKQFGEAIWEKEMSSLNQEAQVYLRANTMRIGVAQLLDELGAAQVEVSILDDRLFADCDAPPIKLCKRQRLQSLEAYKKGLFEIQDASSQLVAPFLQVRPGMMVIDACAGAGGKALHIACLMKNSGKILAMDVEPKKLRELERRATNAGVEIIQTSVITPEEIIKNKGKADRLLLDVPCSGLGVLKRNPDAKWKLSAAFIEDIQQTQAKILREYALMLKPGGLMVYATCSILPSENEQQIAAFIAQHASTYTLVKDLRIMPSQGYDGFYMALIKRLPMSN
jgi:16S rRNA (cytosine967-C5)-methyltransferase